MATNPLDDLQARVGKKLDPPKLVELKHVSTIVAERREPTWLLKHIVEARVLAILAGPRSTFKSFIALDWAIRMALDGHPGVILSGEGSGLDRRIDAWLNQHRESLDVADIPLFALEQPMNLTSALELGALCEAISKCHPKIKFVIIDTLSKFSTGLDENDNAAVAEFLSQLSLCLREELNCTVLLVAHSGHGDAKRPRGASALMANPDCEWIVERGDVQAMTVTVSRERFKDGAALPPLAYEARVIDLGRVDQYGDAVTSLALVSADAPPSSNRLKAVGKNQSKAVTALKEWLRANPGANHITSIAITDLLRAQGLNYNRRPEVLTYLVNIRVLTPSIGGYAIHKEML